jgi:hypothetical protein
MPRGIPKPRKGKGKWAWRSRQKRGAIMKPSTFEHIKRSAARRKGTRSAKAEAGKAYQVALNKKYRERNK